MATAPTPGVGRRLEAVEDAQDMLVLRVRDETLRLGIKNLPMSEKHQVRVQTGIPFDQYMVNFAQDTYTMLWWLARRVNGEPSLSWRQALSEWPSGLTSDDFGYEEEDAESGDDPEV